MKALLIYVILLLIKIFLSEEDDPYNMNDYKDLSPAPPGPGSKGCNRIVDNTSLGMCSIATMDDKWKCCYLSTVNKCRYFPIKGSDFETYKKRFVELYDTKIKCDSSKIKLSFISMFSLFSLIF